VIIVDDPDKGIQEDNLIEHLGQNKSCKHLQGNKPGEYSCALHDKSWYNETPCFNHGQIERDINCECRMGRHILNKENEEWVAQQKK